VSADHPASGDEPHPGHAGRPLYHVAYCSRAADSIDEAAVARIVDTARRRNPEYGITGMLTFGSGIFFQWLEGPRDNIAGLMAQLRQDVRHDRIVLLSETEEVRERMFPDWDMEWVGCDHIREVLQDALDTARDPHQAEALSELLAQLDDGALAGLDVR